MLLTSLLRGLSLFVVVAHCATTNDTDVPTSRYLLPSTFKPPQVFKNANLIRSINLDKGYPRETINVVIENTDSATHDEYYVPFEASAIARIGGFEAMDKKDVSRGQLQVDHVEYDPYSPTQFYRIKLPEPLQPGVQQTLAISYSILAALEPLPAAIAQTEKQYLQYSFNSYANSAYHTLKQKTKIKFPNTDIPDFYTGKNSEDKDDPQRQGSSFSYGPYNDVEAGAVESVSVRYEYTHSINHASLLERDIEVSHWGGNLATEERYWLTNRAAALKGQFSRAAWAGAAYYDPPTSALKELKIPLTIGSANAYFIDDIGNVTTSRFRSTKREAKLEIKPRYPVFGDWNYKFKIGWDRELKSALRKLSKGDGYVLKVPFLEGPKQTEGIEYEKVVVRVILPEGAQNVQFETSVQLVSVEHSLHRSFMDTIGRTTLKLTALNLVDDFRDRDLIVTYDYPFTAGLRKPLTIFIGILGIFGGAWMLSLLDTSIGRKAQ